MTGTKKKVGRNMDFINQLEESMKHYTTTGAFLTGKSDEGVNTMVVSWGFIGFLWNKPHFIVLVRPQRYTKKMLDKGSSFTISIPYGTMKGELGICGSQSGADIDKSKVVEFIPSKSVESPIVNGCDMYYECTINYVDKFEDELISEMVKSKFYKDDFHHVYIGEIVNCYAK